MYITIFCSFFTDTPPPDIYTLSLHDALPISAVLAPSTQRRRLVHSVPSSGLRAIAGWRRAQPPATRLPTCRRSEEHTSELQSPYDLVCRLLLEKKKNHRPP